METRENHLGGDVAAASAPAYKGYAYTKDKAERKVLTGDSWENLLEKVQKLNQERPDNAFKVCNISTYNPDTEKYEGYRSFDVETGKDITKHYLDIPRNLDKESFQNMLQYFKENGAKYNRYTRKWYITEGMQEKFQDYLLKEPEKKENQKESIEEPTHQPAAESGKTSPRVYLEMPKQLDEEAFRSMLQYFKENGARYDGVERKWYIQEELQEKFQDYLPGKPKENEKQENFWEEYPDEERQRLEESLDRNSRFRSYQNQFSEEQRKNKIYYESSPIELFENLDMRYTVDLKDGGHLEIKQSEIVKAAGVNSIEELRMTEILEVLEMKVQEYMTAKIEEEQSQTENEVKTESAEKSESGVKPESAEKPEPSVEWQSAEQVHLYTPEYQQRENGIREICGMKQISGELQHTTETLYVVRESSGKVTEIPKAECYDERQKQVLERAISKGFSSEQIDLIGQTKLSAAQMEQVYNGLQDGLSVYQVALYANPSTPVLNMDLYRYGLGNGITFDDVKNVISKNSMKQTAWEDSRNMLNKMVKAQRNMIVKDLKNNEIVPKKFLVTNIEKLNGMTGKINSVKSIMSTLKEKSAESSFFKTDSGKMMQSIGKEISHQKKMLFMKKVPAEQVPMR